MIKLLKRLSLVIPVILVSLTILLSGCAGATTFLNDPATQAVITNAENIATQFVTNWLTHLGAAKNAKANAMAQARAAIKAKYPTMPDNMVNDIVAAAFSGH